MLYFEVLFFTLSKEEWIGKSLDIDGGTSAVETKRESADVGERVAYDGRW